MSQVSPANHAGPPARLIVSTANHAASPARLQPSGANLAPCRAWLQPSSANLAPCGARLIPDFMPVYNIYAGRWKEKSMYFVRLLDVDSNVIHSQTVIKQ